MDYGNTVNTDKLAYTAKDLCLMTGLNKNNLRLYRETGLLGYIKVGNKYLYPYDEVMRFLETCKGMDISNKYTILASMKGKR